MARAASSEPRARAAGAGAAAAGAATLLRRAPSPRAAAAPGPAPGSASPMGSGPACFARAQSARDVRTARAASDGIFGGDGAARTAGRWGVHAGGLGLGLAASERHVVPRRTKRSRSNDVIGRPAATAAAQALAQAAAQAAAWHDDSRDRLMGTVVFHVVALRAIVLGFSAAVLLLGLRVSLDSLGALAWLGVADQGSCAAFEDAAQTAATAPGPGADASDWCRDAQVWDRVHLVGADLHVTSTATLAACCAVCSERRGCVGLSHNTVTGRCVLFKESVSDAVQASWTRSLVMTQGDGDLNRRSRPARETERWDIASTFRHAFAPPTFSVETAYRDPATRNRRTRTDYRDHVTGALRDVGLVPLSPHTSSTHADLVWSLHWESQREFAEARLSAAQLLNMVPGMLTASLGEKDALHRTTLAARARFGDSVIDSFMLRSLILPGDSTALDLEEAAEAVWIWKPLRSWSGDGISVLTGAQAQARATHERLGAHKVVLQKYILQPLTLAGHKFDARWWAIVTSVSPLRVYSVPDAYVRPAALAYRTDLAGLSDKCIHVTNGKVFKHCKGTRKSGLGAHRVRDPSFLPALRDERGGTLTAALRDQIRRSLVSDTQAVLVKAILMGLHSLVDAQNWTQARCFQLLSFDVIYDAATASPWVEEVNTNGFLGSGVLEVSRAMGSDILRDMFALVGAAGYDRVPYQASLEHAVLRRGAAASQSAPALQAAVDELYAPQRSWKLVYPPVQEGPDADDDGLVALGAAAGDDPGHGKLLAEILPGIPGKPAVLKRSAQTLAAPGH